MATSRKKLEEALPEDSIHAAWLRRPDIAALSPEERAVRWEQARVNISRFMDTLATLDCIFVPPEE